MTAIAYRNGWNPRAKSLDLIATAVEICREYARQGYDLTLRQLYYQFVARDIIPNSQLSYDNLGSLLVEARYHGMLDWSFIQDRTRNLAGNSHWTHPGSIISSAASSYRIDMWDDQPRRVEVWVEKEAMAGIVGRAAGAMDVDYFCCRGYVSVSEMHNAGRRFSGYSDAGQAVTVLYLGDHDPSGIDMSRDIEDRLREFTGDTDGDWLDVKRIALNMDQVREYAPPPNPAKVGDSRARDYIERFGTSSWELDALRPQVLDTLIRDEVTALRVGYLYDARVALQREQRDGLNLLASRYDEAMAWLRSEYGPDDNDE
jgi:hypothetical protein